MLSGGVNTELIPKHGSGMGSNRGHEADFTSILLKKVNGNEIPFVK